MQKRGQITFLVVAGIIIVALAILFLALKSELLVSEWERQREEAMIVPEKAEEVQGFVQACIEEAAEEAVILLGMQGGYITLPETHLVTPGHPFATYLEIFPNSELRTAYWFYRAPNNIQRSGMPSLEKMQNELSRYIEDNLAACTNDFELFELYNITAGQIVAETEIQEGQVLFTVNYPLHIELYDFDYRMDTFYADINIKLGELHSMAKEIVESNNNKFFLEEKAIDVLAMNEEIPFSGTEFTCSPKLWTKSKVKTALIQALSENMQFIKIRATNFDVTDKYFVWNALKKAHRDISTSFRYSANWPLNMEIYPSEGELLKAEPLTKIDNPAMAFMVALFCLTDYNFVYDVEFPVLVTLTDKEGYMFQFATMVIIDNNQPRENKLGTLEFPEPEPRICDNAVTPATIYALAPDKDGNLNPVKGAKITLKCIATTCDVGITTMETRGESLLRTKLPQCVNALLTADKEGYHQAREIVSTVEEQTHNLLLEPYKKLDYKLVIVEDGMERAVEEDETVIFTIENSDLKFSRTLTEPEGTVELIASDLDVRSTLITEGFDIKIESKEITHCVKVPTKNILGLLGFEEEKCTTASTEDMELDQVLRGGSEFIWQLSRPDLELAEKVTFYIPAGDIPTDIDELEQAYTNMENPLLVIPPMLE